MRVTLIFVLYKTPKKEAERLKREVKSLGFQDYILHFVDNTKNNRGYAAGVNEGIKKGLKNGTDLFIIANPDISLQGLTADRILTAKKSFDVWGFAMKQNGKTYYGGFLDHLRMSGGLNEKKPRVRFFKCDFVSGSLMCIKREVVDMIGLWDESYFLYYEDADYCYRAKRAGFKVGIDSYTAYQHFEASGGSIAKQSYLAKNRIKFLIRYGTFRQKLYELIRLPKTILERQRAFTRNLIFLNASSLFNKILNFILFIFLVRYLTVQEYGVYTLVWTHVALLAPVLDFGTTVYGLVHLPTQKTKKINSLFSLRFALSIIVFVLTLTLAMVFRFRGEVFFFVFLTSFTIFSNMMSGSFLLTSSIREKLVAPSLVSIGFNLALISALIGSLVISTKLPGIFYVIFIAYNFYTVVNYFLLKKQAKSLTLTFDFREWLTNIFS
ncbi:glycosyltransferase [Candidatus Roizmanbacteria bacterium]|nr:glycosyltransferase [Candidatus Roizmanbacteria bacterium]